MRDVDTTAMVPQQSAMVRPPVWIIQRSAVQCGVDATSGDSKNPTGVNGTQTIW